MFQCPTVVFKEAINFGNGSSSRLLRSPYMASVIKTVAICANTVSLYLTPSNMTPLGTNMNYNLFDLKFKIIILDGRGLTKKNSLKWSLVRDSQNRKCLQKRRWDEYHTVNVVQAIFRTMNYVMFEKNCQQVHMQNYLH